MKLQLPRFLRKRMRSTPSSSSSSSPSSSMKNTKSLHAMTSLDSNLAGISFASTSSSPSRTAPFSEASRSKGVLQAQKVSTMGEIVVVQEETTGKVESQFVSKLPSCNPNHELEEAFLRFDANRDGKISALELGSVLRLLGDNPSDEELHLMVKEVDRDGDGFIDLQEFILLNSASTSSGDEDLHANCNAFVKIIRHQFGYSREKREFHGCHFYRMISIIFTLLTLLAAALVPAPAAQQSVTDFQYGFCNTAVFSSTDGFAQNLNSVANSFNQNSSQFLYSLASSETGSNSDYVYGMYQCRGDVSLSDCSSCVFNAMAKFRNSSSGVALICGSLARGARVRYRGCYLRYENYNFNSDDAIDFETSPTCTGSSNESSALYQQNLGIALENSAAAAPKHALFGYNATSVGSGSANTAYVLTQCLGYVNSSRCTACLSQVSNYSNVCNRSVSGEIYFHTCFYLFSNTSFLFTYKNSPPTNSTPPSQAPTILASSPPPERTSKNNTPTIAGVVVGVCLLLAIIITLALCFLKRRSKKASKPAEIYKSQDLSEQADEQMFTQRPGTRRFSLKELQDATENFHPKNKLGEGGFGPVYQGKLISGMEVAIKMLSAQSHQGKAEFLNEVNLIGSVQHRNLIQLIGCCMEDSKPLLIYEYLSNRSLDLHLFGVDENNALDWNTRFDIIVGIARGLKYLHEDSPIRIIHRDIKASNILLDNNLNPKIADFGLARLFADDRTHLTTRVAGTLGYLAPEYAINGQLTEKADVYSFGLVALEIVSGRKAVENKSNMNKENLLEWTWELYENQQQLQIMDTRMQKTRDNLSTHVSMQVNVGEVIRVVHVALLCTQLRPQERPSMFEVYNMLSGQSEILRLPTKPITISMLSPINDRMHDDTSGILSSSTMPSYTSEPSVPLMYSYDADAISQVEPR